MELHPKSPLVLYEQQERFSSVGEDEVVTSPSSDPRYKEYVARLREQAKRARAEYEDAMMALQHGTGVVELIRRYKPKKWPTVFFERLMDYFFDQKDEEAINRLMSLDLKGLSSRLAGRLLEHDSNKFVFYISRFSNLDASIARELLRLGYESTVFNRTTVFVLSDKELSALAIEEGKARAMLEYWEDVEVHMGEVAGDCERIEFLSYEEKRELFEKALERGCSLQRLISAIHYRFSREDGVALVRKCIDSGHAGEIANNLSSFEERDPDKPQAYFPKDIGQRLIREGYAAHVAAFCFGGLFEGLTYHEPILAMIDQGQPEQALRILKDIGLEGSRQVDGSIARFLVERGYGQQMWNAHYLFEHLDEVVANWVVEERGAWYLSESLYQFRNLPFCLAEKLDQENCLFSRNFEEIRGAFLLCIFSREFARRNLSLSRRFETSQYILCYPEQFPDLDTWSKATVLMSAWGSPETAGHKNISILLEGADQELAVLLAQGWMTRGVLERPREFWQVTPTASPLVQEGFEFLYDDSLPRKQRESEEVMSLIGVIPREGLMARQNFGLTPREYQLVTGNVGKPEVLARDGKGRVKDPEAMFAAMLKGVEHGNEYDDQILTALRRGREVFGAAAMLRYMNRLNLSRHDAVFFMEEIIALQEKSGLSPERFAAAILFQVADDDSTYEEGTAHHHFRTICQELSKASFDPKDPNSIPSQLRKYASLESVKAFAELVEGASVFSSWRMLKKANQATKFLLRKDIMDALIQEPNPRLRAYVERLAFHPNISMEAVFQFWRETAKFLDINDEHVPEAVRQVKKPKEYLSAPYLGLTAEDLRDALVGRATEMRSTLDRLQKFPPMEMTLELMEHPENDANVPVNLWRLMLEALGRAGKDGGPVVKGKARDARKLFGTLVAIINQANQRFQVQAQGKPAVRFTFDAIRSNAKALEEVKRLDPETYEKIRAAVFSLEFGMAQPEIGRQTYKACLGWKSDPEMIIAGDDTACCMAFGSGKLSTYMYSPAFAQFVLQRKVDTKWRTVAQSVMMMHQDTSHLVSDWIAAFEENLTEEDSTGDDSSKEDSTSWVDLVRPEDFAKPKYIACDNIQPAKNETDLRVGLIAEAYRRFWREYLKKYAKQLGVDPKKVPIGKGYSPENLGFTEEENTSVSVILPSYSDNIEDKCFVLRTGLTEADLEKDLTGQSEARKASLRPLDVQDVLAIAHLESKTYADNAALGYGINKVQNNVLGICIADEYFNRPNLSFVYQPEGKQALAYIIAYEGVHEQEEERLPIVYVDDMAAEKRGSPVAGAVLLKFIESYIQAYKDRPQFPPIVTEARDQTSYRLIRTQLEKLGKRYGLRTELIEMGESEEGGETMHRVGIIVGRSPEEIEAQKESYWF